MQAWPGLAGANFLRGTFGIVDKSNQEKEYTDAEKSFVVKVSWTSYSVLRNLVDG